MLVIIINIILLSILWTHRRFVSWEIFNQTVCQRKLNMLILTAKMTVMATDMVKDTVITQDILMKMASISSLIRLENPVSTYGNLIKLADKNFINSILS